MKMYEGVTLKDEKKENAIVWLNIDNDTYEDKKWNNLFFTPRDQLKELIKFSVKEGADIVIVDVNFGYTVGPESSNDYKTGDEDFKKFLETYSQKSGRKAKIILAGTFDYNETYRCVEKRESFLDEVVFGDIYWGDPMFHVEEDGTIRRFQLWEPICSTKSGQVIPSIPLLIKILKNTEESIKKGSNLHDFSPDCLKIKLTDKEIRKRIIYSMPWKPGKKDPVETSEFLKVISAGKTCDCKAEDIKGKIVMIGGSHDDCQDFCKTPLGWMPGSLVIINAIHSLLHFDENKEGLCWWKKISIFTLFVIIISFFFTRFDSFKACILSNMAIVVILLFLMILFPTRLFLLSPDVLYSFVMPWIIVNILNSLLCFKDFIFRSGD